MDDLDTLVQVREIGRTLERLGYQTEELAVPENLGVFRRIIRGKRDCLFFNLTDPRLGEGRFIALPVLALAQEGCRYTGSTADALYLSSNKLLAKQMMILGGIPTASCILQEGSADAVKLSGSFVPGRYIIKSVWEHGSAGLTSESVFEAVSRQEAEHRLSQEPKGFFAEAFLPGREINISLIAGANGNWEFLPPSEIIYTDKDNRSPFLDYISKWDETSEAYSLSAVNLDFPEEDYGLLEQLRRISLRCVILFGLNGYARVDFRLDAEGRPMVMEVNANPCLSPGAGFVASAERAGLAYAALIERIVKAALAG